MAKNPFEQAQLSAEETKRLYEQEIADLKKNIIKTREGLLAQRRRKGLTQEDQDILDGFERQLAQREREMREWVAEAGRTEFVEKEKDGKNQIGAKEEKQKASHVRKAEKKAKAAERRVLRKALDSGSAQTEHWEYSEPPQPASTRTEPSEQEEQVVEEEQEKEKKPQYPWEDEEKIQAKIKENEEIEQESPETMEELQTEMDALSADWERYKKDKESAKTDAEREAASKELTKTELLHSAAVYRELYKKGESKENSIVGEEAFKKNAQQLSAIEDIKLEFFDAYFANKKKELEEYDKRERAEREQGSQEVWAPEEIEEPESPDEFIILGEAEERERLKGVGQGTKKAEIERKEEKELRQKIARRIDAVYQVFEEARGDQKRLEVLGYSVEQSLEKYRQAVRRGEHALPEEELRLIQLQRKIEKALEELAQDEPRHAQEDRERGKEKKEEVKEAPPQVQEALNVAIDNIEMYYESAGDDRRKIENALNAIESVLGDIRNAKQDGRWDALNQSDRLWKLHKEIREKLKNV
jgi:hypothetical protein